VLIISAPQFAGEGVPELDLVVVAAGEDEGVVRAPGNEGEGLGVSVEDVENSDVVRSPNLRKLQRQKSSGDSCKRFGGAELP
jgi:hypothetical protein